EAVHKELGDRLVRVATTASSLEAEQDSGGGPRCQEALRDTIAQTRFENVSKYSNDLLLTKTTQSNEIASLKRRVKKLEKRNRSRTHKLKRLYKVGLTARVESSDDEESLGEAASKQKRRIDVINPNKDITIVSVQDNAVMFDVNDDLGGEEVFVEQEVTGLNENVVKEVYMLVKKTYPLTLPILSMMLEKKLQNDYQSEMAYQLLKLIKKQLKK
nr:hypothetical protein [Tanacetum cinerariifolium]